MGRVFTSNLKMYMSCSTWNERILDSLTPPHSIFAGGARLLIAPAARPASADPTAAVQVGGVLLLAMLHSCPAARRVASAVVAIDVLPTCVPSLRKLVVMSPPPGIPEGNDSHTPTLMRVAVLRSRSTHNHPSLRPRPRPLQTRRRPPHELSFTTLQ